MQDILEFTSGRVAHDVCNFTATLGGGQKPTTNQKRFVVATKTRIFMKVPHVLFKFTTADEDGGLVGSVGADRGTAAPRAVTSLGRKVAAQERCSHIKTRIFIE